MVSVAAPNDGLESKEVERWNGLVRQVIHELYPLLFGEVKPGDLKAIHQIFNESKSLNPSPSRLKFEAQMRKIRSLKEDAFLYGVI